MIEDGLSRAEIAEYTGINIGKVKYLVAINFGLFYHITLDYSTT